MQRPILPTRKLSGFSNLDINTLSMQQLLTHLESTKDYSLITEEKALELLRDAHLDKNRIIIDIILKKFPELVIKLNSELAMRALITYIHVNEEYQTEEIITHILNHHNLVRSDQNEIISSIIFHKFPTKAFNLKNRRALANARETTRIVVVVDTSGSMGGSNLFKVLDSIDKKYRGFELIMFTFSSEGNAKQLPRFTSRPPIGGSTYATKVLELVETYINSLSSGIYVYLYIITDGEWNDSNTAYLKQFKTPNLIGVTMVFTDNTPLKAVDIHKDQLPYKFNNIPVKIFRMEIFNAKEYSASSREVIGRIRKHIRQGSRTPYPHRIGVFFANEYLFPYMEKYERDYLIHFTFSLELVRTQNQLNQIIEKSSKFIIYASQEDIDRLQSLGLNVSKLQVAPIGIEMISEENYIEKFNALIDKTNDETMVIASSKVYESFFGISILKELLTDSLNIHKLFIKILKTCNQRDIDSFLFQIMSFMNVLRDQVESTSLTCAMGQSHFAYIWKMANHMKHTLTKHSIHITSFLTKLEELEDSSTITESDLYQSKLQLLGSIDQTNDVISETIRFIDGRYSSELAKLANDTKNDNTSKIEILKSLMRTAKSSDKGDTIEGELQKINKINQKCKRCYLLIENTTFDSKPERDTFTDKVIAIKNFQSGEHLNTLRHLLSKIKIVSKSTPDAIEVAICNEGIAKFLQLLGKHYNTIYSPYVVSQIVSWLFVHYMEETDFTKNKFISVIMKVAKQIIMQHIVGLTNMTDPSSLNFSSFWTNILHRLSINEYFTTRSNELNENLDSCWDLIPSERETYLYRLSTPKLEKVDIINASIYIQNACMLQEQEKNKVRFITIDPKFDPSNYIKVLTGGGVSVGELIETWKKEDKNSSLNEEQIDQVKAWIRTEINKEHENKILYHMYYGNWKTTSKYILSHKAYFAIRWKFIQEDLIVKHIFNNPTNPDVIRVLFNDNFKDAHPIETLEGGMQKDKLLVYWNTYKSINSGELSDLGDYPIFDNEEQKNEFIKWISEQKDPHFYKMANTVIGYNHIGEAILKKLSKLMEPSELIKPFAVNLHVLMKIHKLMVHAFSNDIIGKGHTRDELIHLFNTYYDMEDIPELQPATYSHKSEREAIDQILSEMNIFQPRVKFNLEEFNNNVVLDLDFDGLSEMMEEKEEAPIQECSDPISFEPILNPVYIAGDEIEHLKNSDLYIFDRDSILSYIRSSGRIYGGKRISNHPIKRSQIDESMILPVVNPAYLENHARYLRSIENESD